MSFGIYLSRRNRLRRSKTPPMPNSVCLLGEFQEGKSTLVNCLLSTPDFPEVARVGDGLPTTKLATRYRYDSVAAVRGRGNWPQTLWELSISAYMERREALPSCQYVTVELPHNALRLFEVVDCPGLDSADPADRAVADHEANNATFLLLVLRRGFPSGNALIVNFLKDKLMVRKKPYGIIINCGREPALACPSSEASKAVEQSVRDTLNTAGFPPPSFCQRVNLKSYFQAVQESGRPDVFSALHQLGWILGESVQTPKQIESSSQPNQCDRCGLQRGTGKFRSDDGKPDLVWKCGNCGSVICRGCIEQLKSVGPERLCACGAIISGRQRSDKNRSVEW